MPKITYRGTPTIRASQAKRIHKEGTVLDANPCTVAGKPALTKDVQYKGRLYRLYIGPSVTMGDLNPRVCEAFPRH